MNQKNRKQDGVKAGKRIKENVMAGSEQERQDAENKAAKTNKAAETEKTAEAEVVSNFPEAECEAKLKELEAKLKEEGDKHLRAVADMENLRKRMGKEMENLRLNVLMDTISPFLQVFDHFSMAVSASASSNNLKSLLEGMKMIQNEFDKAFSELGVTKIEAVGEMFDPNLHEAVSQEASDTVPSGKVIRQWSCGYKTPLRLLKPAMVVVSSGPESKKSE